MALTTNQREKAWKYWSDHRAPPELITTAKFTKDEIRAALDAGTTWVENNQAGFVASLNGTAFGGAGSTADEKLRLFLSILAARYGIEV